MALIIEAAILLLALAMSVFAALRISAPLTTSPWLMPLLVGLAMTLVSGALLVSEMRERRLAAAAPPQPVDPGEPRPGFARIAGWLALSAGYAVAVPIAGFEVATVVFLVLALRLFGAADWKTVAGVSLGMALAIPLVFRHVFFTLVP